MAVAIGLEVVAILAQLRRDRGAGQDLYPDLALACDGDNPSVAFLPNEVDQALEPGLSLPQFLFHRGEKLFDRPAASSAMSITRSTNSAGSREAAQAGHVTRAAWFIVRSATMMLPAAASIAASCAGRLGSGEHGLSYLASAR